MNSLYINVNTNTPISKTTFDVATTKLLFKYYIHLLIYELLQLPTKINTDLSVVDNASFLNTGMLFQNTAQYINICFDISINNKNIVNKEVKSIMDSIINIKNIEKNILLTNLGKLTDEEHMSNKVLKMLKLKRWSVPKNLRSYTKSGYDEDSGIYEEDDAFNYDATEDDPDDTYEEDGNDEDNGEIDENGIPDLDFVNDDIDFDIDLNWDDLDKELPDDFGDTVIEDGDYYNVSTLP